MKYRDLSQYQYQRLPRPIPSVLNVGWLDNDEYPRGKGPGDFLEKLGALISRGPVNQMRCIDPCPICGEEEIRAKVGGQYLLLGTAEVWVPAPRCAHVYAAPDLIWHFVDKHQYLPPREFIDAVMCFPTPSDWSGDRLRESLVAELYRALPAE